MTNRIFSAVQLSLGEIIFSPTPRGIIHILLIGFAALFLSLSSLAQSCGYLSFQQADMWATSPQARSVTWDGTRFMTTISTTLFTSPDGLQWTAHDTGCEWAIDSVVSDGQLWIAQCFQGLARSTDGITSTPVTFPSAGCSIGVSHQGDYFFAGCNSGLFSSRDGLQWTPLPVLGSPANGIAYGNGLYVVSGPGTLLYTSTDLVHWNTGYFPATVTSVIFENGTFLAYASGGAVLASTDGKYWQQADVPEPVVMAHGGGRFLELAEQYAYTSTDGLNWTAAPYSGYFQYPYTLVYGAGCFVGTSEQGIMVTQDGSAWQALWPWAGTYQVPHTSPNYDLNAQRFSAVVGYAMPQGGYWALRLSEDGRTWSEYPIQPLPQNSGFARRAASDGNGQWVVVGSQDHDGAWAATTDLVTWSSGSIPGTTGLIDVAYGAGRYVAVGGGGAIAVSPDGTHWSAAASPSTHQLQRVVYGHGRFIAMGWDLLESEDGQTWNLLSVGWGSYVDLSVLPFGFSSWGSNAGLAISDDGLVWNDLGAGMGIKSALHPWMGQYIASGGTIPGRPNPGKFILTDDFANWSYVHSNLLNPPQAIASNGDTLLVDDSAFTIGCLEPSLPWTAPLTGPSEGGNSITLTGASLSSCDAVYFGEAPSPSFTIDSDTQVTAIAPAYAGIDAVPISVGSQGNPRHFEWSAPYTYSMDPVVASWAPTVLSTVGGQGMAISGHGFGSYPSVDLGSGLYPLVYQVVLEGGLTGITQPLPPGTYDLTLQPYNGPSVTIPDALTYEDPPVIAAAGFRINPARLVITGDGFRPGCIVQIDGLPIGLKKYKGTGKLIATAQGLKKLLRKREVHIISVVNPDGLVSGPYPFQR